VGKLRPAGQMWPTKKFSLACDIEILLETKPFINIYFLIHIIGCTVITRKSRCLWMCKFWGPSAFTYYLNLIYLQLYMRKSSGTHSKIGIIHDSTSKSS
jgi:hypothetical protein